MPDEIEAVLPCVVGCCAKVDSSEQLKDELAHDRSCSRVEIEALLRLPHRQKYCHP